MGRLGTADEIGQVVAFLVSNAVRYITGATLNVDLEDCDHILHVETSVGNVARIVGLLDAHGFQCEELPD